MLKVVVVVADFLIPACKVAVEDYRRENGIKEPLQIIGYVNGKPLGAYWKKSR